MLVLLAAYLSTAVINSNSYAAQRLELELNKRLSDAAKRLNLEFKLSKKNKNKIILKKNFSGLCCGRHSFNGHSYFNIYPFLVRLFDRKMCKVF